MRTKTKSSKKSISKLRKPPVKKTVEDIKIEFVSPVKNVSGVSGETIEVKQQEPVMNETTTQTEIPKPEISTIDIPVSTNTDSQKVNTLSSQSMMDDLLQATDKDTEEEHETDFDLQTETETETGSTGEKSSTFGDRLTDTITSNGEDWENVADFRKMCSINALMYVEGGAIFLSFLGQLISGDWSKEGETKYMPSEERRKLIRNPLAKKLELSKNRKRSSPTGAMVTAIIFTVLPIIIIAFKDRKSKIDKELKEIEANKLREELERSNAVIGQLRNQINSITPQTPIQVPTNRPSNFNRVEKRGRHKKDCDCDRCNLARMKTKKQKV